MSTRCRTGSFPCCFCFVSSSLFTVHHKFIVLSCTVLVLVCVVHALSVSPCCLVCRQLGAESVACVARVEQQRRDAALRVHGGALHAGETGRSHRGAPPARPPPAVRPSAALSVSLVLFSIDLFFVVGFVDFKCSSFGASCHNCCSTGAAETSVQVM